MTTQTRNPIHLTVDAGRSVEDLFVFTAWVSRSTVPGEGPRQAGASA
jgi:hypothetical protein